MPQGKPSSAVLVATHMLGRSHDCPTELAYSFSTIFRLLTCLSLNLTELSIQRFVSLMLSRMRGRLWKRGVLSSQIFSLQRCKQNFSAGKAKPKCAGKKYDSNSLLSVATI